MWRWRSIRTCCEITCGFAFSNKGHNTQALQANLGDTNIQHTVSYTELSPTRFLKFFEAVLLAKA